MKHVVFVISLGLVFLIGSSMAFEAKATNKTSERDEKFLSLFSIVRFANSQCYGTNGNNGTCLTSQECSQNGGTAAGTCAAGFGVCCTVLLTQCGSTVTLNNTYWQNSGYTSTTTTAGQCSLSIRKCSSNICQFRLDFINFVIANPDASSATTYTQCLTDIFTVSGTSNNVPGICGTNTNQHMYLALPPDTNSVTLNMLLTGTSTSRSWNILITQIPCGTTYTAPDNCLQWFTSATGTLTSYDYQFAATPAVQKLANQDYTICIRSNLGFCGICYTACTGIPSTASAFLLSVVSPAATAIDGACSNDWIQIPCAMDYQNTGTVLSTGGTNGCLSRICGSIFSAKGAATTAAPVYSYRKPFEVRVFTDSYDAANTASIGFCLSYTQLPCTSVSG